MKFFDTHAHIGLIHEDPIEQLIVTQEARQQGVDGILSICNNLHDFFQVYENLRTASNVYFAIGVSPSEVQNPGFDWKEKLEQGVELDRVVAVGETGLDYFRKFGDKNSQVELFIYQLEFAARKGLPVVIHNRDAGKDVLDILSNRLPAQGGILHCYSENWDYAKKALELNLFISFAGNVTYRNAKNLHETARNMPLERMLIESESPFMIPAQYRGKRNNPSYIHSTAEFIADLRGMDRAEFADIVRQNARNLFGIT